MIITISEFAKERNVDRVAVNAWIRNHPEVDKACQKQGKEKIINTLTDEYKALEKQYPLPKPVEVIEDTESRKKLIQAQELIIQMQDKLLDAQQKIAAAEATKLLLEDKEQQLGKAEQQIDKQQKAIEQEREANDKLRQELEDAKARINELEHRSFWQRLFNK